MRQDEPPGRCKPAAPVDVAGSADEHRAPSPGLAQTVRFDFSCRDLALTHRIQIARSVKMLARGARKPRSVSGLTAHGARSLICCATPG